jgi:acetylglutamate kinase
MKNQIPFQAGNGAVSKAATLIEALPWLARFHGEIVVLKYGGNAMSDDALREAFAQDVVFLRYAGLRPVVVHGGGPQINAHLDRLGIETTFAAGLRVTTKETMDVVRMVLTGQVNREIVGLINAHGPFAVGMSGEDAHLMIARRMQVEVDGQPVDLGQVGEVVTVNPGAVQALLADGRIPVISSVASSESGEVLNINADTAAAALAVALGAAKLVFLTDVAGLYPHWSGKDVASALAARPISQLTADELAALMPGLSDGMIPKMSGCLTAVLGGVPQAHVLDGRLPHAILLEIFTDSGIGTMVVPNAAGSGPLATATSPATPTNPQVPEGADHVSD